MKTIRIVFMLIALVFGLASCMQGTEDVNVNEDKLEAPVDETAVDEPDIPLNEEVDGKVLKGRDSDENPIMDTVQ